MTKTTHGGYRPGSGRKTKDRIHREKVFTIFEDQMPLTDAELRERPDFLEAFKNKGYHVAPLNEALRAFHKSGATDGDEKCVLMLYWNGRTKASLIIGAI